MTYLYWSDLHLNHRNILTYTGRPFADIEAHDAALLATWRAVLEESSAVLVNGGDLSFRFDPTNLPRVPNRNVLVLGNHDDRRPAVRNQYYEVFGTVMGTPNTWELNHAILMDNGARVLVSHNPQQDLRGCDYNVYGHIHANWDRDTDGYHVQRWPWLPESTRHLNASLERVGYRPRTLQELIDLRSTYPNP